MTAHNSDLNTPNLEHVLREAKSLWDLIAHERVKERLEAVFFHFSFGSSRGVGRGDAYQTYSALASRLQHSGSKLPSRELEEAVSRLADSGIQKAFEIYEDETPQRRITNVQLLWLVYNLGLVPFIETEVLRDTCFRLDKAQPSLGLNIYRVDAERFFLYNSPGLRKEFPVVIRIVDALKAEWRQKISRRSQEINAPLVASIPETQPSGIKNSGEEALKNPAQPKVREPDPDMIQKHELHAAVQDATTLTTVVGQHEDAREVPDSGTTAQATEEASSSRPEVPRPSIAANNGNWEDIEIFFLSDDRVQIHMGKMRPTLNYADFGFQDDRTENPNGAWRALIRFAELDGLIRDGTQARLPWKKFEKRVQEIRKVFRKHFGIPSDPIPYVEGLGYRARFKIRCGRSFRT